MSAVIRYSALLVAISAAACSAQLPLPTALPSFHNLVPELRNRVPKANVLSALDGPPFNATLQGFVLSGLLEDYGKLPAIVVQPTGARGINVTTLHCQRLVLTAHQCEASGSFSHQRTTAQVPERFLPWYT